MCIKEYVITNNEYYPDYETISIFTHEDIPELEWKKLLFEAQKVCSWKIEEIDEFTGENMTFWHCNWKWVADYIVQNDKRFFFSTEISVVHVGTFSEEQSQVGIQSYSHI